MTRIVAYAERICRSHAISGDTRQVPLETTNREDLSMTTDELLGIPEVAAMLGTSESTVRWWRATGVGPKSWKAGRRVRYWRGDVLAWLQAQENMTAVGGVR